MGCLLREYCWPLAMQFRAKREVVWRDLRGKRCQLVDFRWKRKVCGASSAEQVPTHGFSAKKEVVWRDLPAIFHNSAKKEGGWHNLSKEKCQLADFQQKRKLCGVTSRNSLFLCLPVQIKCSLNAPMGDVKRKWWVGLMESYVLNGCAQWEVRCWTLLECSTGIYNLLSWTLLGYSMGIQVLNRNLGAQREL